MNPFFMNKNIKRLLTKPGNTKTSRYNTMKYIFVVLLSTGCHNLMAQVNFVRTWSATAPETNPNTLMTRPISDAKQVIQYVDGLGRPIQTVAKQGSLETATGTNTDVVVPSVYDGFGRSNIGYLPYISTAADGAYKTDALTAQPAYYNNATNPIAGQGELGVNAHTQVNFEPSPLNRPLLSMAAGNSWVGATRGVQSGYWLNTAADDVKIWTVSGGSASVFGTYIVAGPYPQGTLYKNVTTDENNKQVIEFKDMEGKVILKKVQLTAANDIATTGSGYTGWLCTYYMYDNLSNLRAVIQPAGVATLSTTSWVLTTTILNEQCFRYEYDARNRMTMKKVPGAAETNIVYDQRDRMVMMQDGNMRTTGKWMVTVYDALDRPIQTGLLTDATVFATQLSNAYNSSAYPSIAANFELLTQTHYDDYAGLPAGLTATLSSTGGWGTIFGATNNSLFPYPQMPAQNGSPITTRGQVTWAQVKVVGTAATYLSSASIYDNKGRVVQVQGQNISGGTDVSTTQYTWGGQPLMMVQSQQKAGNLAQTMVTVTQITYDVLNRAVRTDKKVSNTLVNSNALTGFITVSAMQYDALGQLKQKQLGKKRDASGNYTTNPLDIQNYEYNIRGWLLGVNRAYVRDVSTASSAINSGETFTTPPSYTAGNYFGFDLGYDKTANNLPNGQSYTAAQYNGNISGTVWKSVHDGQIRKYDFTYDAVNRLTAANFTQYTGSTFNNTSGLNFGVSNLSYDANGNILSMNQMGLLTPTATSSALIDQLTYTYIPGSNKLQQVTDAANNFSSTLGDFKYNPATKTATDYTYDVNGNLISDINKAISTIQYNFLNLPQQITVTGKGTISYTYDAAGNKLQKTTVDNATAKTMVTTYIGGAVYENDTLRFTAQEEGRLRKNTANTGYIFDYYLKDHLGNIRMTITDDHTITNPVIDASSYYAFGLRIANISQSGIGSTVNRYKFNGIEYNTDFDINTYDAFYRNLDPQIGRFLQLDPKPTDMESLYAAMGNNPIKNTDFLGDTTIFYTAAGVELLRTTENNKALGNAITFVTDDNLKSFNSYASTISSGGGNLSEDCSVQLLRGQGESYDVKGMFNFVDANAKNNPNTETNIWKPSDGKGPLINEQSAAMEKKGGVWAPNPGKTDKSPGSPFAVSIQGSGVTMHTHENEGRKYTQTLNGVTKNGRVESGKESVGADGDIRGAQNKPGSGLMQMAVSKKNVYFYNGSGVVLTVGRDLFDPKYFKK
jgi:RHS repeat-associated protein